ADYIMIILFQFWYFASMYLLTAINVERCLSALFPLWYRCRRPKHFTQRRHPGKIYVAILLSVNFMLILGLPFSIVVLIYPVFYETAFIYISCLLTSLNSSVNPVIY
ncbi:PREDICTED: mas-related G-protein coupled receptor member X3-like, partial [Merops nubicus]|uniref:mas-related G-protein coupled receptor member X3-like n=1 Tax=Merops nubicus TaxID=57421 RepID=UPI0004F05F53